MRADCAARGEDYASIFYGTKSGLERDILARSPIALRTIPSRPLRRRLSPDLALTLGANALGIARAASELRAFGPDVVVATGGYVCFPVVVAARTRRKVALALLEENAYPGLTNKLLAPLVDEVWGATWTQPAAFKRRFVTTGIPVRTEFKAPPPRPRARERLGIEPHARVVLVMGGSQGARSINEATSALVTQRELPRDWWILHVCGARDYEHVRLAQRERKAHNRVTLVPYLDDPVPAYAAADLVVARAGASTLAELAVARRASLLIPYPYASDDHQTANARVFQEAGAARLLFDAELGGDVLWWALEEAFRAGTGAMEQAAASLAPADAAAMIVRRVNLLRQGGRTRADEERGS
ncbi:MAG: UDP-N-acetylglucosamine--N-acetylmuramyl-(pentapeptide) pyrophosphoryl-undecaprenol N-acetylglucosamine transferase [Candidatus Eremiobacteraeota bacterium]|nr:UDP-N-acetylglucosamine--N-acetylmuramyl-(pentapeptide) pyrophosphoryl-undecaprenol N-acetylglucosamine transferase [Candidatus Eremiobacteraeota bacterium]